MDPPLRSISRFRPCFQAGIASRAGRASTPERALGCGPMNAKFEELRQRLAEESDLARAAALPGWDQETMMPPRGAPVRAEQLATLSRVIHQKFTAPAIGGLLDDLAGLEQEHPPESFEASTIRVVRRDWEKASKVPSDLRAEMAR